MATDQVANHQPGRYGRWMAALAFLFVVGVALLPRAFASDGSKTGSHVATPDFLQRYNPEAGLAAICREPEILGEAHGLCGLGGASRTSSRAPGAPPITKDIRFATEGPEPTHLDTPAIDHWDIGFSQLPAVALGDGGSGLSGFGGALSISGGGNGIGGFLILDDDDGNGNRGPTPFGCDPETEDCDGDSDTEPPPEKQVPEPSAALLFGLGFAAILRRQSALR